MKVGIIGAGYLARMWADSVKSHGGDVQLVYAPDATATQFAQAHGATVARSAEDVFTASDALLIASSTSSHLEHLKAASRTGKRVLCASPIAADCEAIGELGAASNVFASFPLRHKVEFTHLKQAAESGKLGEIGIVRISIGRSTAARAAAWYRDEDQSGGVLLDVGVHAIDILQHCFGPIDRIHAVQSEAKPDYALAVARLKSGAIAHLECSWAEPTGGEFCAFEVSGVNGIMEYDSRKERTLQIANKTSTETPNASAVSEEIAAEIGLFLRGEANLAGIPETCEVLGLARAAEESVREFVSH